MTKQTQHLVGVHSLERREVEVPEVKEVLAAGLVDDQFPDEIDVTRFAVWCEPHHFVLTLIYLETQVTGDGAVEQTYRVWEFNCLQNLQVIAAATSEAGRIHSPTPSTVRIAASLKPE